MMPPLAVAIAVIPTTLSSSSLLFGVSLWVPNDQCNAVAGKLSIIASKSVRTKVSMVKFNGISSLFDI